MAALQETNKHAVGRLLSEALQALPDLEVPTVCAPCDPAGGVPTVLDLLVPLPFISTALTCDLGLVIAQDLALPTALNSFQPAGDDLRAVAGKFSLAATGHKSELPSIEDLRSVSGQQLNCGCCVGNLWPAVNGPMGAAGSSLHHHHFRDRRCSTCHGNWPPRCVWVCRTCKPGSAG